MQGSQESDPGRTSEECCRGHGIGRKLADRANVSWTSRDRASAAARPCRALTWAHRRRVAVISKFEPYNPDKCGKRMHLQVRQSLPRGLDSEASFSTIGSERERKRATVPRENEKHPPLPGPTGQEDGNEARCY